MNFSEYEISLTPDNIIPFPEAGTFIKEYPGVCLVTRNINPLLLYSAYMQGAFPWFNEDEGEPVVWHSPSPRFVLEMKNLHIPKSLKKFLKHTPFTYTMDHCFDQVINECRLQKREGQNGSWIGPKMIKVYNQFHQLGFAHSIEAWNGNVLAGGFYGVLIGRIFFGESMFTKESESSKSAFAVFAQAFARAGGKLIDSQVYTDNIARYGAENISRDAFLHMEKSLLYSELDLDLETCFYQVAESI